MTPSMIGNPLAERLHRMFSNLLTADVASSLPIVSWPAASMSMANRPDEATDRQVADVCAMEKPTRGG